MSQSQGTGAIQASGHQPNGGSAAHSMREEAAASRNVCQLPAGLEGGAFDELPCFADLAADLACLVDWVGFARSIVAVRFVVQSVLGTLV